jgi:hypothetical protein
MSIFRVLMWCVVAAALPAQAQKNCSQADTMAAEKAIERIVTWQNLQKAWHDYRHCDKGTVEEGFTDALMRLMVGWKNVDVIAGAMAKDAEFKAFVQKHLQSPAAKDDREDLYALAKKNCPAKQDAFCADLAEMSKPGSGSAKASAPETLNFDTIKPIGSSSSAPAKK